MTAPDPGFAFWTHGRRDVDRTAMLAELRDEAAKRRDVYPRWIGQNRMTEMEARHELNLIDALIAEFAWEMGDPHPRNAFTWTAKINGLRREIMLRRNTYPRRIQQGRMTQAEAMRRLVAIEACHAWYWKHGLDFMEGTDPDERRRNIRAEIARRAVWALEQGYEPAATDAVFTGDWSNCPRRPTEEQAA